MKLASLMISVNFRGEWTELEQMITKLELMSNQLELMSNQLELMVT